MSSKGKQNSVRTETNRNKIYFGCVSACFVKPKTKNFVLFQFVSVFRTYIETTETNRTVSKQTETTLNFLKNTKASSLSNCFGWSSVCFGSIETSKLAVSVKKRNNRNKHFASDSAETSFGSSFCCFESELVTKDNLATAHNCRGYRGRPPMVF
jgi:hypothetical protein